jgi:ParB family chromosome partitioning protein
VERLGRPRITAVVLKNGDSETLALVENLQRSDLDPIDEAEALVALKEGRGCTLEALHQLVGKSVSYLCEIMSVARLPVAILNEARAFAAEGRPVPRASLVELARIKSEEAQLATWHAMSTGAHGRAGVRALRKKSDSERDSSIRPAPHAIAQRIERLAELLARTHDDTCWMQAELRQALLSLRSRINMVLDDVG